MATLEYPSVKNLLIELGCEEIPAFVQEGAAEFLHNFLVQRLKELNFKVEGGKYFATPRRLAALIKVSPYSEEVLIEKKGPPLKVAYDDKGNPTKALLSFLKGIGANLEDVYTIREGDKEYVGVKVKGGGEFIGDVIGNLILEYIGSVPLPKRMRWDNSGITFIRPIRWILCILEDEVLNFRLGNISSSNITYLSRVPENRSVVIDKAEYYERILEENDIIPDFQKRKKRIKEEIEKFFPIIEGDFERYNVDVENLIYEITGLVEKGFAIYGKFDESFLKNLYPDVITVAMVSHQRYVPHIENGRLHAGFVAFSNNPKNLSGQVKGFENVLKARLNDALFYKNEDLKRPLDWYVGNLRNILWLKGVGTLYDKTQKVLEVVKNLPDVGINENLIFVAKHYLFDTATSMIADGKEFTKLEGKIGYYYVKDITGNENLARAIYDSHLPKGNEFPKTYEGHIVALADNIVQIRGLLDMGYKWTSSRDPLGIRMSARKLIALLLYDNNGITLGRKPLKGFLKFFDKHSDAVVSLIEELLPTSVEYLQRIFNYPYYPIKGKFTQLTFKGENLFLECVKAKVLEVILLGGDAERFITITKRVKNILEAKPTKFLKDEGGYERYEEALKDYLSQLEISLSKALKWENLDNEGVFSLWNEYMGNLMGLYDILDEFFSNVPVMVEDEGKRNYRLNLLKKAYGLIGEVLRFDRVEGFI